MLLHVLAAGSLTHHQLLLFWLQLFLLVAVARALGGLMRRIGQPAVIGELAAGLLLGPSVLGTLAPAVHQFVFPGDEVQSALILAISWLGVALLLVVTGFETDLKLLGSLGRSSLTVSIGSLVLPLLLGFWLGQLLPAGFLAEEGARLPFALFMAVALSISSLPVVAKILLEMGLMRRNIGQVIVAAGMANDLLGWILLGTVAGIARGGGLAVGPLLLTIGAITLFLVFALTLGQRLVDLALRAARKAGGTAPAFAAVILITLGAGVLTQVIGVEAVLGAFVAGIVLGQSRYMREEIRSSIEVFVSAFLAPVFFATAGLAVDLGALADPTTLMWTAVVVAVAAVAKLGGSYAGARLGGIGGRAALAIGIGLNARGALEIVVATIGRSLGVLNDASYAAVVVMAMLTSMMAPPLLRRALAGMETEPEEAERLEREHVFGTSVIANVANVLVPTRGGTNSLLAARLLDRALPSEATITVLTAHAAGDDEARERADVAAAQLHERTGGRRLERLAQSSDDVAAAICTEANLGYGLVAMGMTETLSGTPGPSPVPLPGLSPVLRSVLAELPVPMLLVKHAKDLDPNAAELPFRRIMVPTTGTKVGRAAEEIAYLLGTGLQARVEVVHVVNRVDQAATPDGPELVRASSAAVGILREARSRAEKFGKEDARLSLRSGSLVGPELALAATEHDADLLVLGARVRNYGGQPFLGHGVEWLLEHAVETTLAVVVFPGETAD